MAPAEKCILLSGNLGTIVWSFVASVDTTDIEPLLMTLVSPAYRLYISGSQAYFEI